MAAPTQQDIQQLKNSVDKLCLLIDSTIAKDATISELISKLPTNSITRNKSLTGTLATLSSETCISVTLRNNGNSLIYTSNGGNEQTMIANEIQTIFVSNANLISVKGTGTLEYIVDKA